MNLPNKLTVLRVIMVPFFVFSYLDKVEIMHNIFHADRRGRSCKQMDRIDYFLRGKSYRYAGRKDRQGQKSCNQFRKVYGSAGR